MSSSTALTAPNIAQEPQILSVMVNLSDVKISADNAVDTANRKAEAEFMSFIAQMKSNLEEVERQRAQLKVQLTTITTREQAFKEVHKLAIKTAKEELKTAKEQVVFLQNELTAAKAAKTAAQTALASANATEAAAQTALASANAAEAASLATTWFV